MLDKRSTGKIRRTVNVQKQKQRLTALGETAMGSSSSVGAHAGPGHGSGS